MTYEVYAFREGDRKKIKSKFPIENHKDAMMVGNILCADIGALTYIIRNGNREETHFAGQRPTDEKPTHRYRLVWIGDNPSGGRYLGEEELKDTVIFHARAHAVKHWNEWGNVWHVEIFEDGFNTGCVIRMDDGGFGWQSADIGRGVYRRPYPLTRNGRTIQN